MTLSEFIATRRAVDCVETACGFNADMPNQPGYAYADSLYIEIRPDDAFYLILERDEFEDRGAEGLARLETLLYAYGLAAGVIESPARYLCAWGEGYGSPASQRVGFEFFDEGRSYTHEHRAQILRLAVGQCANLSDPSGEHFVCRVA